VPPNQSAELSEELFEKHSDQTCENKENGSFIFFSGMKIFRSEVLLESCMGSFYRSECNPPLTALNQFCFLRPSFPHVFSGNLGETLTDRIKIA
jgi:hypothetical protein